MAGERTVLIVDDDKDIRSLLRILMSVSLAVEVVAEAVDGLDALSVFDRVNAPPVPHVIVLDNSMPGLSGLDVAEQILARFHDQRIVLFTAFVDDALRDRAREIGISRVVAKEEMTSLPEIIAEL